MGQFGRNFLRGFAYGMNPQSMRLMEESQQTNLDPEAEREKIEARKAADTIDRYYKGSVSAIPSMKMARSVGDDKWAKPGVTPEELQRIAEGQVLNEMTGGTRRGLADLYGLADNTSETATQFKQGLDKQDAFEQNRYGRSGPGALLAFSQSEEGKAMAESTRKVIDMMRSKGGYDEIELAAAENMLGTDVRRANQKIFDMTVKPGDARRIVEETTDASADKAYKVSRAGKEGSTAGLDRLSDKMRSGLEGLYGGIGELDRAIVSFDAKFVGPIEGRVGTVQQKLGTIGADAAVFREIVQRFMNELIKARSGSAVTDQEFERIKTETMDFSLNDKAYMAKLKSNRDFLKRKVNRTLESQQKANVDVSQYKMFEGIGGSLDSVGRKNDKPDDENDELSRLLFGDE